MTTGAWANASFRPHKPHCLWAAGIACVVTMSLAAVALDAAAQDSQNAAPGSAAVQQPPAAATVQQAPTQPVAPAQAVPSGPAASPPPQAPTADRPGFLHQLKVWWSEGFASLNAKMKDAKDRIDDFNKKSSEAAKDAATATQEAMKSAAEATKNATSAVARLPSTRVVEMRARCERAPNGGPDCEAAATSSCREKGFTTGHPVDVRSSEHCPAAVVMSGEAPAPGACAVETTVLRAVCQ